MTALRHGSSGNAPAPVRPTGPAYGIRQRVGLLAGPVVFTTMMLSPAPEGLAPEGWRVAAVGVLMAVWWITESLPIPVTALLPILLFPLLGVGTVGEATAPYANPLIFLFLGGFVLALAIERWELHRRIALNIVRVMGTRPRSIIAGFMTASALLSMWVSNTATALMMLPIALSVVGLERHPDGEEGASTDADFAVPLLLGIAYACSIGGLGTLIGTPPNALLAGFMSETYGVRIGFAQWMLVGVPLVLVGVPAAHLVLTRVVYPVGRGRLIGGRELLDQELRRLGPVSRAEAMVAGVAGSVALLWVTQPLLAGYVPGLSDTGIAVLGAAVLFVIPVNLRRAEFLMDWKTAERLPWGVLLLFGGGLSLASAVSRTGLAEWIGGGLAEVRFWPIVLVILLTTAIVVLLTELTSNTATAAAFLPIVSSVAVGIGQNPLLLAVPTVLAASCAFMLPVATPPNAIVYGSGVLSVPQMARAGIALNVLFTLLIVGLAYSLVLLVFGVEPGVVPPWALQPSSTR